MGPWRVWTTLVSLRQAKLELAFKPLYTKLVRRSLRRRFRDLQRPQERQALGVRRRNIESRIREPHLAVRIRTARLSQGLNRSMLEIGKLELLSANELPSWFNYPRAFTRLVERGITHLDPWWIFDRKFAREKMAGLKSRYPSRDLVPFARNQGNDDVACWER